MQLRYLFHSGFLVEADDFIMIIDYYNDNCAGQRMPQNGVIDDATLRNAKKVYVLSSHAHGDHFIPRIFQWADIRDDIRYVLSFDIKRIPQNLPHVARLDVGGTYKDDTLCIEAFGSTDEGVSFLIRAGDKTFFHAGDLNNWHWNEECDEAEAAGYENAFLRELGAIQNKCAKMDAAMFPLDPRLGKEYAKGAMQFLDAIDVDLFAPMHFGTDYACVQQFASYAKEHCGRYAAWEHRGQVVQF